MNAGISRLMTVLAILAIVLVVRVAPSAHAGASTVYADGDGNRACASLTPCYLTIQTAVNNAGGPEDAEVRVFPGTYAESVNLSTLSSAGNHTLANLALKTVDATGNPAAGTATIHGNAPISTGGQNFPKDVTLDGFVIEATKADGVYIHTLGSITIHHTSVNNPGDGNADDGDDGFDLATEGGGSVTIDDSSAQHAHGNLGDGFQIVTSGGATLHNVQANDNVGTQDNVGINMPDSQGDITLDGVTANGNSEEGIYVYTTGTIFLSGEASDNSGFHGADLFTELGYGPVAQSSTQQVNPAITVKGLTASGNADDGLIAQAGGDILVRETQANENDTRGMSLLSAGSVDLIDSHVENNVEQGVYIEAEEHVTITKASAIDNGDSGDGEAGIQIVGFGGDLNSVMINDSFVQDNFGQGIDLSNLAADGVHNISSNVICGNSKGGLRNKGTSLTIPAEGNWWGNGNGPTSPQNPGGQGDKINAGGDGTIDFAPWITHVKGSQMAGPAGASGVPSTILFEFADDADTVFLNNGPGDDLIGSPLAVATDNGTITIGGTTGASVQGFIEDTQLQATLTPAHVGQAIVTLSGPCNLTTQLVLDIGSGVPRGDLDCNGSIELPDLMRSLRFTAGVALAAIDGCAAGLGNFDLDCGGTANGLDPLLLVLFLASVQSAINLPVDCPHVGS
jgi:hypothetical protein